MKRFFIDLILVIVCFILQTTVFPMLNITSMIPNILIILVSCCGFMQGDREGLLVGFACGCLMDIYSFDVFGFYTLVYMFIGYLNGFFHNFFYLNDLKIPAALITGSDFIFCLLTYFVLFLMRSKFEFKIYFTKIIIPEVAFTLLLAIFIYPILWLIEAYVFGKKNRETQ